MNRQEAEDLVYRSYMKAEKYQRYDDPDAKKRRPDLTFDLIRSFESAPCALVTGSKGKGSAAGMIAAVMSTRMRTGLMTSPHIRSFCERFKVDGENISDEEFVSCMTYLEKDIDKIEKNLPLNICISPMGIQAALALYYFGQKGTRFNVLECGKGVRYDDVGNVRHEYAVINTIFLEHTRELGRTTREIAENKSYIMTGEQKCAYAARSDEDVMDVLRKRAAETGTPLKCMGEDFGAENIRYERGGICFDVWTRKNRYTDLHLPLLGSFQAGNCALALALCEDAADHLDQDAVQRALSGFKRSGRMEVLCEEPFRMLDACINRASTPPVLEALSRLGIKEADVIIGIPDDKDYLGVAMAMRKIARRIILTRSDHPHYIFTDRQAEALEREGLPCIQTGSAEEALDIADESGLPAVILGTTCVVADMLAQKSRFPVSGLRS